MRVSIGFGVGFAVASLLAVGCGGDGADHGNQAIVNAGSGGEEVFEGGEPESSAGRGVQETAGAGGSPAAICPAVLGVQTTARIDADFPMPFAFAQTGVFSACRNDECLPITLHGDVAGDLNPGLATGEAPIPGEDPSPLPPRARVSVWNATGEAYAPPAPYVTLGWYLRPDPSDYQRTDTYTLSLEHDGTSTELIHRAVTYTRTLFQVGYSAPDPERCANWGEAVVDLRSTH